MRRLWYRELIDEMREENRARREEHKRWLVEWRAQAAEQKRRFDRIDAAMENDKRVTRDMILELREGRDRDRDMRDEIRVQREVCSGSSTSSAAATTGRAQRAPSA